MKALTELLGFLDVLAETGFNFLKAMLVFWRTAYRRSAALTLPLNDRAFEWDAL